MNGFEFEPLPQFPCNNETTLAFTSALLTILRRLK